MHCPKSPPFLSLLNNIPLEMKTIFTILLILHEGISLRKRTSTFSVIKRNKTIEEFDKNIFYSDILQKCENLDMRFISPSVLVSKVVDGLVDKVTSSDLNSLLAETAASLSQDHPDYLTIASRVEIESLHKNTPPKFSIAIEFLRNLETNKSLISDELYQIVRTNKEKIDNEINATWDFNFDYFGFKTLEKSYLLRLGDKIIETPQYLFMRVALGVHGSDLSSAFETYRLMANKWFVHATPTLFHSGTPSPQMSSCFLLTTIEDSIEGIYETLSRCAKISKHAGGVGLSVHNIRAKGSVIASTQGKSNGLVPMLRVFDATARYVDQGGGKRPGAIAIYLEPWHADILDVLDLRKNTGKEEKRTRDLFFGLWIPDLFMTRVQQGGNWSLFCPSEAPGLSDCYGPVFDDLYRRYEKEGRARREVSARSLWNSIMTAQMETGNPYILFKDSCNSKSNQRNVGVIKGSNLCTEIIEYSSANETAVCNLASIILPRFVFQSVDRDRDGDDIAASGRKYFDHNELYRITKVITRNLNCIIDRNYYPDDTARHSNFRHRPIGIGVQGLADVFQILNISFDCEEAKKLNREIFETIYYAALNTSCELAMVDGPYDTYEGSPISQGELQQDLWNVSRSLSSRWPWGELRRNIKRWGVRNSLLVAPMPTASSAQIMGNNECIEPYTRYRYMCVYVDM